MFTKILTLFLLSSALAVPTPDTSISTDVIEVNATLGGIPPGQSVQHGTCSFHVTTQQMCWPGSKTSTPETYFFMPFIRDDSGATIMVPGGYISADKQHTIGTKGVGLAHDLTVLYTQVYKTMVYTFGPHSSWYARDGRGRGKNSECGVGTWSRGDLDCKKEGGAKRWQDMDCFFRC